MGEFCGHAEAAVGRALAGLPAAMRPQVLRMARIFSGSDPAFDPIKGYHGVSLPGKLQADLGAYWQDHRGEYADDAVAVLFDWLGAHVVDAVKRSQGDDAVLGSILKPPLQHAVLVLLGIEARQAAELTPEIT